MKGIEITRNFLKRILADGNKGVTKDTSYSAIEIFWGCPANLEYKQTFAVKTS